MSESTRNAVANDTKSVTTRSNGASESTRNAVANDTKFVRSSSAPYVGEGQEIAAGNQCICPTSAYMPAFCKTSRSSALLFEMKCSVSCVKFFAYDSVSLRSVLMSSAQ